MADNSFGDGLTINGATHGFNSEGVGSYLNDIKIDLVDKITDAMDTNFHNIEEGVHRAWVGKSADTFIENMRRQVTMVENAMNEGYSVVQDVVLHALNNMNNLDQTLVPTLFTKGDNGGEQ